MSPEMQWAWRKARDRDEETIDLCRRTSWGGPRDYLADCRHCGCPFWVPGDRGGGSHEQVFCCASHRVAWHYRNTPGVGERQRARARRYWAELRARSVA